MVEGTQLHLKLNLKPARDANKGCKQNLVHTKAQGKEQWPPQKTEPDLPLSIWVPPVEVWVSSGLPQKQGLWQQQSWEVQYAGISTFEGGLHYCHYPYHSLASGQTTGREHSPTHQQTIGLKIYWAWPPKGNQSWIFIGRTDAEAEAPILWLPDVKNWLTRKDPDAGKDWRQEEKVTTEDELVGWHHRLDGHDFEQTPGVGDGQGSRACCSPWDRKESDRTEWLDWTELSMVFSTRARPSSPHSQSVPSGSFHKPLILIHQRADRMKTKLTKLTTWMAALSNSVKLWAMPCRATQDKRVMVESSAKCGPREKGMGNKFSSLDLRTPLKVWKSKKNTRVVCYFLLQGIFPTQGSNQQILRLLHWEHILYHWTTWKAPKTGHNSRRFSEFCAGGRKLAG